MFYEFSVKYTGKDNVQKAFDGVYKSLSRASQVGILARVGEYYLADTKSRFDNQRDIDRKRWAPNTEWTERLKRKGMKGKDPAKRGPSHVGIWTEKLQKSLRWDIEGNDVVIWTDVNYSRYFHYGVKVNSGIKNRITRKNNRFLPPTDLVRATAWATIPPRPFLGRNKRIDDAVVGIVHDELAKIIGIDPKSSGRRYL